MRTYNESWEIGLLTGRIHTLRTPWRCMSKEASCRLLWEKCEYEESLGFSQPQSHKAQTTALVTRNMIFFAQSRESTPEEAKGQGGIRSCDCRMVTISERKTSGNSHSNRLGQVNLADKTFCLESTNISLVYTIALAISSPFPFICLLSSNYKI